MLRIIALGCLVGLAAIALGIAFWSVIIMLVWNFLVVPAFHAGPIDWVQAIVVALVLSIIQSTLASGRINNARS
jgi:uncharacterized membrane protein